MPLGETFSTKPGFKKISGETFSTETGFKKQVTRIVATAIGYHSIEGLEEQMNSWISLL